MSHTNDLSVAASMLQFKQLSKAQRADARRSRITKDRVEKLEADVAMLKAELERLAPAEDHNPLTECECDEGHCLVLQNCRLDSRNITINRQAGLDDAYADEQADADNNHGQDDPVDIFDGTAIGYMLSEKGLLGFTAMPEHATVASDRPGDHHPLSCPSVELQLRFAHTDLHNAQCELENFKISLHGCATGGAEYRIENELAGRCGQIVDRIVKLERRADREVIDRVGAYRPPTRATDDIPF